MTAKQNALYWSEWQKAKRAARQSGTDLTECDRHTIHIEALGPSGTESHKDFSNEDFDKVLAAFRAISNPNSLNAQLRQQEQPSTRLDHRIADQLKCLALFVDHPDSYIRAILRNRFHVEQIADLDEPNDLIQLRNTLAARLSKFRREYVGPNGTFTEHDMCARAGVECFRKGCAECRQRDAAPNNSDSTIAELATVAACGQSGSDQEEENPF